MKRPLQLSLVNTHCAGLKTGSDQLYPVEDVYKPDLVKEAIEVFGADDPAHPSVAYLRSRVQDFYIGGKVQAIKLPIHFDYAALRCEFFISPTFFIFESSIKYFIQIHLPNFALNSKNFLGEKWLHFKLAIPCIEHIVSSQFEQLVNDKRYVSSPHKKYNPLPITKLRAS